jgi:hypothetical protein
MASHRTSGNVRHAEPHYLEEDPGVLALAGLVQHLNMVQQRSLRPRHISSLTSI